MWVRNASRKESVAWTRTIGTMVVWWEWLLMHTPCCLNTSSTTSKAVDDTACIYGPDWRISLLFTKRTSQLVSSKYIYISYFLSFIYVLHLAQWNIVGYCKRCPRFDSSSALDFSLVFWHPSSIDLYGWLNLTGDDKGQ